MTVNYKDIFCLMLLMVFLSGRCIEDSEDFEFQNNERRFIECYQSGDSIIFTNQKHYFDTIIITKIDTVKGEQCFGIMAPVPIGKRYRIFIKSPQDTSKLGYKLVWLMKYPVENATSFYFNYKNFHEMVYKEEYLLKKDSIVIHNEVIRNCYSISDTGVRYMGDSTRITEIIWTEKYGLTAYQNGIGDWYKILVVD